MLIPKEAMELRQWPGELELETMTRHLVFFGPLPEALIKLVGDEKWCEFLREASQMAADLEANEYPDARLEQWADEMIPNLDAEAKRMISRMAKINPAERATIDDVLDDPWWQMAA